MVRHLTKVMQFGPQPHVWRPCLRRSPGGERGFQGRTGQQTGPNERPGQGRVYSDKHNRRAAEARRGQALRDHDLPSSTNNQGTNSTSELKIPPQNSRTPKNSTTQLTTFHSLQPANEPTELSHHQPTRNEAPETQVDSGTLLPANRRLQALWYHGS